MGRDINALATPKSLTELAQWLRSLRQRSGLSYRQMERLSRLRTNREVPYLRFYRADRGNRLPAWQAVQDYVRICGGDIRRAERLWKNAEAATASADGRSRRHRPALPPQFISEPLELLDAMRALRFDHGNKTLRELELAASDDGVSHLPRSSLSAVLGGKRMPSKPLLLTYIRVCGGVQPDTRAAEMWERAWERADAYRRGHPTPVVQPDTAGQDSTMSGAKPDATGLRSRASAVRRTRAARRSGWRRLAVRFLLPLPPTPLHAGAPPGP
ncbi:hypothetical protein ACFCYF_41875 [Streptomyces chartreusis]|uniref:hypothetical protein n=1 Tax=Streptomyces chartreusis TaxID=1969 RepID=UPI0035E1EC77